MLFAWRSLPRWGPEAGKNIILTTPCRLRGRSCFLVEVRVSIHARQSDGGGYIPFEGHRSQSLWIAISIHACWSCHDVGLSKRGLSRGLSPCRLQVLPLCGLPSLRLSHFMVLPLSRPAASCSAQLTAISARKPSFATSCGFSARKPSFMASLSSLPLSARSLSNTRLPPRVASPRPPYSPS